MKFHKILLVYVAVLVIVFSITVCGSMYFKVYKYYKKCVSMCLPMLCSDEMKYDYDRFSEDCTVSQSQ